MATRDRAHFEPSVKTKIMEKEGTLMKDQLEKAGIKSTENTLLKALSLWRNQGGTVERAHQLVSFAYGEADHRTRETQLMAVGSPTSSGATAGGAGHTLGETLTAAARPKPKEPSAADKAALASSMKTLPLTLHDTFMVGDGKRRKAIGDYRLGSIDALVTAATRRMGYLAFLSGGKAREVAVLQAIKSHAGSTDPNTLIRDAISEKKLKTILHGHGVQELTHHA